MAEIITNPIIFLDIDGVLNCELFFEKRKLNKVNYKDHFEFEKGQICTERVALLNDLCKETGAVVVLSSSWRMGRTVEDMQKLLDVCGGTFKIIDKTPHTGYARGTEIKQWLEDNIKPETYGCDYYDFHKYVIIDDDSDMLLSQQFNYFRTDFYCGLTPNTCYRIKRFLTGQTFGTSI